ncbi:MAG: acyltransferase domain-containing protein [Desulfobacterales bacterium]|nr:acyltransferase domain-containing protein [Desulfobacterales bacterium]MBS3754708.1 acyltransferase domain-containing protein [Desulfobacterales bacterium]
MDTTDQQVEILAFCADNKSEFRQAIRSAARSLSQGSTIAAMGEKTRGTFSESARFRLLLACTDPEAARGNLDSVAGWLQNEEERPPSLPPGVFFGTQAPPGKLAFVFPGQGSQYPFMSRLLLEMFAESKPVIDLAEQAFDRNPPLLSYIYPEDAGTQGTAAYNEAALRNTDVAQPAIGVISRVMVEILRRHGVSADAACGHSYGELTALWAGGKIRNTDFMELSVSRGSLMASAGNASEDRGAMLAVRAPSEKIEILVREHGADLVLANRNSPSQSVLSGPTIEIDRIQEICRKNRIISAKLPVSAAFHSRLVMDAAAPFQQHLESVPFFPGDIPVYANTTAAPYPADERGARELLGRHLLQPVNFIDEIRHMHEDGARTFVEVGPRAVLTGLVKSILSDRPHNAFSVDESAGKKSAVLDMAFTLCRIAALGYPVDLEKWPGRPGA